MNHELPQLLQDVFDSINLGENIIRIDSLRLDLGILPEQNTGQLFKERVAEKIREAIITNKTDGASETGVNTIHKAQSLREALLYFLQTGTLPWFMGAKDRKAWESGMQQAFAQGDWQKIILWLQQNHHQQPVVIERLIHQFSDDFTNRVITLIQIFDKEKWEDIYRDLLYLYKAANSAGKTGARSKVLQLCISSFLEKASLPDALYHVVKELAGEKAVRTTIQSSGSVNSTGRIIQTGIVNEVVEKLKQEQYLSLKKKNEIQDKSNDGSKFLPENKIRQATGDDNDAGTGDDFINDKHNYLSEDAETSETLIAGSKKQPERNNGLLHKSIEDEPQYVSNCGIVLLHPFLEMYFAEFALLRNRKFIDEDARQHAVLLLHYLATGETEGEEWNLLLQKMMCGISSKETLPGRIDITDKEKEETEKLLQSVISYCPPLKNTSIAGLRSTFLQRDGRLEKKENGWLLTVEQKTVDILLDKLPWGFSTIKLPWLADVITVDWC